MKKSDLEKNLIGELCVVYKPNDLKIRGTILRVQRTDLLIGYPNGHTAWWHYKNVRLLKKKQAPVYWVHPRSFTTPSKDWVLWPSPQDEGYIKIKLVRLKDEN